MADDQRPYIAMAGNFVYKQAVKVGVVQAWDEPQSGNYGMLPGPGGARAEAERRRFVIRYSLLEDTNAGCLLRAMALKALDARLASGSPAPGASATPPTSALPETPEAPPLKSTASTRSVTQVPVPEDAVKEAQD
jgi:hypothetical protein